MELSGAIERMAEPLGMFSAKNKCHMGFVHCAPILACRTACIVTEVIARSISHCPAQYGDLMEEKDMEMEQLKQEASRLEDKLREMETSHADELETLQAEAEQSDSEVCLRHSWSLY